MKKIFLLLVCETIGLSCAIAQNLTSSNLPIVIIDTQGQTILDEPKIEAKMKVIFNGAGKRNNVTDAPNNYDGLVGIEYRGSTSQLFFPKKPLGFETRDAQTNGINVELLGFPKEQDWILYPSYNEKTLLHNVIAMKMGRDMGLYASRTQHVEVIINGRYEGIYVLMEKIKRDIGRLDIAKLTDKDNSGDALTGGYIFKIDKTTGSSGSLGWYSKILPIKLANPTMVVNPRTYYQYEYPKPTTITFPQRDYLKTVVDSAEAVLDGTNFKDPAKGYRKYFDSQSFVKIFLLNEVSKNVDGYRISSFFHKDKNSKDRRIKAGPPWDYDIAFGNADYCEAYSYRGWSYLFGQVCPDDYWQMPFHWKKMLEDPAFAGEVYGEYKRLRAGPWKTENLNKYIDSLVVVVDEAQKRNFTRWPVLGVYLWPNPRPVPTTFPEEISYFKSWLTYRLEWLDGNIPGGILAVDETPISELTVEVNPNPFVGNLNLQILAPRKMEVLLELLDATGRVVQTKLEIIEAGKTQKTMAVQSSVGQYFLRVHSPAGVLTKKVLKAE